MKKLTVTLLLALTLLSTGCMPMIATGAATGALVLHDRRTAGTVIEDHSIEFKAHRTVSAMLEDIRGARVSTISYNNSLLLIGQVPDTNLRDSIEAELRQMDKVLKVHNEIQIGQPTSILTRSTDSWITAKVKSEMLLSRELDPTRVKVITEDGTVYLLGIVSKPEEEIAVDIARHTKGVRKVVKIFEYIA